MDGPLISLLRSIRGYTASSLRTGTGGGTEGSDLFEFYVKDDSLAYPGGHADCILVLHGEVAAPGRQRRVWFVGKWSTPDNIGNAIAREPQSSFTPINNAAFEWMPGQGPQTVSIPIPLDGKPGELYIVKAWLEGADWFSSSYTSVVWIVPGAVPNTPPSTAPIPSPPAVTPVNPPTVIPPVRIVTPVNPPTVIPPSSPPSHPPSNFHNDGPETLMSGFTEITTNIQHVTEIRCTVTPQSDAPSPTNQSGYRARYHFTAIFSGEKKLMIPTSSDFTSGAVIVPGDYYNLTLEKVIVTDNGPIPDGHSWRRFVGALDVTVFSGSSPASPGSPPMKKRLIPFFDRPSPFLDWVRAKIGLNTETAIQGTLRAPETRLRPRDVAPSTSRSKIALPLDGYRGVR